MLQESLSMEIAPIGSTHYDACRPSPMSTSAVAAISVARLATFSDKTAASGRAPNLFRGRRHEVILDVVVP